MGEIKKLSSGFAGSTTREMGDFSREVETRMGKRLDTFTDDFSPPGTAGIVSGQDVRKPGQEDGYAKPHDDSRPVASRDFTLAAQKEQDAMNTLDRIEHLFNARVKKMDDQFPGNPNQPKTPTSEVGPLDIHQTDPGRLKKEIRMALAKGQTTWVCRECDREVVGPGTPGQCACGARSWKKQI
jgi:hypothetical protein